MTACNTLWSRGRSRVVALTTHAALAGAAGTVAVQTTIQLAGFAVAILVVRWTDQHPLEAKFQRVSANPPSGMDDDQLLALHQSGMLLPVADSGANNPLVKALFCGLPLVTTDVRGIADCGGGTVFLIVEPGNNERTADLVGHYLGDAEQSNAISQEQREVMVSGMAWLRSAAEHLKFYASVS